MFSKPIEVYVAILAAAIYVFESNREKPFASRFFMTLTSAGLGFSLMTDAAQYVGGSEAIAGVFVTAFGYIVLELGSALLHDRAAIKEILRKRFGGK